MEENEPFLEVSFHPCNNQTQPENGDEHANAPAGEKCFAPRIEDIDTELLEQWMNKRNSLSEIDWHEITNFAQGDFIDPQSFTCNEIEIVIEELGCKELAATFKTFQLKEVEVVKEEHCVSCFANHSWNVVSHWELPVWLRDNDFLWHSHRPQIPSIKQCFISMFRLHTETGNIWTHFIGMLLVIIAMFIVFIRSDDTLRFPSDTLEYAIFAVFFIGSTACLFFSWLFHTCACHSEKTASLLSKLDYTGIAMILVGGFVPCLYYGFYCERLKQIAYVTSMVCLGVASIITSCVDRFATPKFRPVRAGLFISLGLSLVIPCTHMIVDRGFYVAVEEASLMWLFIMAVNVIGGAVLYAVRVPERFFPGKFNLVFQSHQIFHVLVVFGIFFHLHGCCEMARHRIQIGQTCTNLTNNNLTQYIQNSTVLNSQRIH